MIIFSAVHTILFNITDEISRTMAARNGIGTTNYFILRIEPT